MGVVELDCQSSRSAARQGGPGGAVQLNRDVHFELYFHVCTGFHFMNIDCLNSRITCLSFYSHPYSINKCRKGDSSLFGHKKGGP